MLPDMLFHIAVTLLCRDVLQGNLRERGRPGWDDMISHLGWASGQNHICLTYPKRETISPGG
eukprot:4396251-Pyramimonas_sp.AAC.1